MKFRWRDLKEIAAPLAVLILATTIFVVALGLIIDTLLGHKLMPIDQSALSSSLGAAIGVVGTFVGLTFGTRRNKDGNGTDQPPDQPPDTGAE